MSYLDAVQFPSLVGQLSMAAATNNATSGTNSAGTNGATGATNTSGASAAGGRSNSTVSPNELNQLSNPQLFLQLLVAELQNQDPTNPMNPSTILSQTANLSQMEAVNSMTTAIAAEQHATQTSEAAGLIGQTVTASVNKTPLVGKVSQIQLNSNGSPTLVIDGTAVPLSAVTAIGMAPTGGTAGTVPTPGAGTSATPSAGTSTQAASTSTAGAGSSGTGTGAGSGTPGTGAGTSTTAASTSTATVPIPASTGATSTTSAGAPSGTPSAGTTTGTGTSTASATSTSTGATSTGA